MKTAFGATLLGSLFVVTGGLLFAWSQYERRIALAEREFAALRLPATASAFDDLARYEKYAAYVAMLSGIDEEFEIHRAAVRYWSGDYQPLVPDQTANIDRRGIRPEVALIAANAAYRLAEREGGDRATMLRRIETVLTQYADVLKQTPQNLDAAYNYEYLARQRDEISKGRRRGIGRPDVHLARADTAPAADLPEGPTPHGQPGTLFRAPSDEGRQLRTHIPMQPSERNKRQEADEAGRSGAKPRKG